MEGAVWFPEEETLASPEAVEELSNSVAMGTKQNEIKLLLLLLLGFSFSFWKLENNKREKEENLNWPY